ncbi:MAG: GxxExxY protein [Gemmatimonadaceae bacterium]|nr:GxxExxY protein [Gemmatimonadaceae bacterium]
MGQRVHLRHERITYQIIGAFLDVYNALGWGFVESVYQSAMLIALGKRGLSVEREANLPVYYDGKLVGNFRCDLLVERAVLVELKVADQLSKAHSAQLLNYLRASSLEVGVLLNFGENPQRKRLVWSPSGDLHEEPK